MWITFVVYKKERLFVDKNRFFLWFSFAKTIFSCKMNKNNRLIHKQKQKIKWFEI